MASTDFRTVAYLQSTEHDTILGSRVHTTVLHTGQALYVFLFYSEKGKVTELRTDEQGRYGTVGVATNSAWTHSRCTRTGARLRTGSRTAITVRPVPYITPYRYGTEFTTSRSAGCGVRYGLVFNIFSTSMVRTSAVPYSVPYLHGMWEVMASSMVRVISVRYGVRLRLPIFSLLGFRLVPRVLLDSAHHRL